MKQPKIAAPKLVTARSALPPSVRNGRRSALTIDDQEARPLMGVRALHDVAHAIKRPNALDARSESFGNPLHVQTWIVEVQADEAVLSRSSSPSRCTRGP